MLGSHPSDPGSNPGGSPKFAALVKRRHTAPRKQRLRACRFNSYKRHQLLYRYYKGGCRNHPPTFQPYAEG